MNEELADWLMEKHTRVAKVIPVASRDPWTLHGEENVCVGCLHTFVTEYLADIPETIRVVEEQDETGGI